MEARPLTPPSDGLQVCGLRSQHTDFGATLQAQQESGQGEPSQLASLA